MLGIEDRIHALRKSTKALEVSLIQAQAKRDSMQEQLDRAKSELEKLRLDEEQHLYAIEVFKKITTEKSDDAKNTLEGVLNWALSNIKFEQEYEARIIESTRGVTGKELSIELTDKNTGHKRSVRDQSGTALAQIISFLMLVITIKFSGKTRIVVLDEVFSGLEDPETLGMFFSIMVALSKNEDFQFILVEHAQQIATIPGVDVIELELTDYEKGTVIKRRELIEEDTEE